MVGPAYKVVVEGNLEGPADKDNHQGKPRAFEELPFEVAFVEDSHTLVEAYIPEDIVKAQHRPFEVAQLLHLLVSGWLRLL